VWLQLAVMAGVSLNRNSKARERAEAPPFPPPPDQRQDHRAPPAIRKVLPPTQPKQNEIRVSMDLIKASQARLLFSLSTRCKQTPQWVAPIDTRERRDTTQEGELASRGAEGCEPARATVLCKGCCG
jgi:hypothetical protein